MNSPVSQVWAVGALCRAMADTLTARFNLVNVRGELSGFSRAASGHCYFSLKDSSGQLRCALFKRAAAGLDFDPRDGELVEVTARVSIYEPRGDLQLIVEGMRRAGQGSLYEEFLRLKAKLQAQGLFDAQRKRALALMPRGIGLVTSLAAAALHDVVSTLRRRAPHLPVVLVPAAVQGANAPAELCEALSKLYLLAQVDKGLDCDLLHKRKTPPATPPIDVILLVRGGGALEDLWAFNDEQLAQTIARSPVPLVCGVGHETDFTIADFVADVRAPTPTAAAEMVAQPRDAWLGALEVQQRRLQGALERMLDRQGQRLDNAASRLGRPSQRLTTQQLRLSAAAQRLNSATRAVLQCHQQHLQQLGPQLPIATQRGLSAQARQLDRASLRLGLLDPHLVLARGYAWLTDAQGLAIGRAAQTRAGQDLRATLVDGTVDLRVLHRPG
ncbi:MAG: exodeoxyribonuclease VII large subunit [Rhodoferax sp.]|nr:exodeoxyribonuclease VII large subunit [Rhodoferax sp.]